MSPTDRLTVPDPSEDVDAHLATITDHRRREDALAATALMREVSGEHGTMWGASIVGFGHQPYTTSDGVQRTWFAIGLAARKAALTLYGLTYYGSHADLLERLGPHTTGKGCLYVTRMDALDQDVLRALVERAWAQNHQG